MNHISLHSEYILNFLGIPLTNTFLTTIFVTLILSIIALLSYYSKNKNIFLQSIETLIYQMLKITDTITDSRTISKQVFPLVATFFIFILTANIIALFPGFLGSFYVLNHSEKASLLRSPNSDLTLTLALAIISVIATQVFSFQSLGFKEHIKKYFNIKTPLTFFIGFMELLSETTKILSFSFRLFGNVFAGEVLLIIMGFLIPYFIPIPFMVMELFVGIIQSYIFALLTMSFIKSNIKTL